MSSRRATTRVIICAKTGKPIVVIERRLPSRNGRTQGSRADDDCPTARLAADKRELVDWLIAENVDLRRVLA
jgi:hypothetical protein